MIVCGGKHILCKPRTPCGVCKFASVPHYHHGKDTQFSGKGDLLSKYSHLITEPKLNLRAAASLISEFGKVKDIGHVISIFEFLLKTKCKLDLPIIRSYIMACKNNYYYVNIARLWTLLGQEQIRPDEMIVGSICNACELSNDKDTALQILVYFKSIKYKNDVEAVLDTFKYATTVTNPPPSVIKAVLLECIRCNQHTRALEVWKYICAQKLSIDSSWVHSLCLIVEKTEAEGLATSLLRSFKERELTPNLIDCTQLLQAFVNLHIPSVVGEILQILLDNNITCDDKAWSVIIGACSRSRSLEIGKKVHQQLQQEGKDTSVHISTALINMYGKTGALDLAQKIFAQHKSTLDVGLWTSLLTAYGHNGRAKEALEIFSQMRHFKVPINSITFLGLLNACSHAGLVGNAEKILGLMEDYGIVPQPSHLTCMADVYGRAGRLDKAEYIISQVQPNEVLYHTVLGACRKFGDVKRARRVAQLALQLNPTNSVVFVMMAHICHDAGLIAEEKAWLEKMKKQGIKKKPGITWITVEAKAHIFYANDHQHPDIKAIVATLPSVLSQMAKSGYVHKKCHVTEESENFEQHKYHSEKLALVYGLMATPAGTPLVLGNILRMCEDCHKFSAVFAKTFGRSLVVGDANRSHNFNQKGECDCGNYW